MAKTPYLSRLSSSMLIQFLILRKVIVVTCTAYSHSDSNKILHLTTYATENWERAVPGSKKTISHASNSSLSNQDGYYSVQSAYSYDEWMNKGNVPTNILGRDRNRFHSGRTILAKTEGYI